MANARSSVSIIEEERLPMKWVKAVLGMLTSSSQWILLSCFRPCSIPSGTCVDKPSNEEYTGAQIAVENRESNRV